MYGEAQTNRYSGMKVTIMGLGLHGGGLESARYLARHGAILTVTDLRDERVLAPSIEKLGDFPVRYVLGRHEDDDFRNADMVIKNPGVKPDSPFLLMARRVETDISLFLVPNPARLIAVTGSKGKSGTASAIHWGLCRARDAGLLPGRAWLGGNITVSPLTFLEDLTAEDDVVLELSSWQLGDLKGRLHPNRAAANPAALLKPRVAVLTAIMSDHQNWYGSMEPYVADKRIIYQGQDEGDATIALDDDWGRSFLNETRARPIVCTAASADLVPQKLLTPGLHQRQNLLSAGLALLDLGLPADFIRDSLGRFPGIEHRLEFFHEKGGIRFYNDTTATIPEAAAAAINAFDVPLVLVTGGTDKNLDFAPLVNAAAQARNR